MWARTAMQGEARISTTQGAADRRATTASATPSTMTAGMLSGLFLLLMGAGLATAAPAAGRRRPDASRRAGHPRSELPSRRARRRGRRPAPAPYFVRLATTRQPSGEDQATVTPGTTVTLRSDDVAYGETIDGRLEFTARDGSGVTYVDELETTASPGPPARTATRSTTRRSRTPRRRPTTPAPSSAGSEQPSGSAPSSTPSRTPAEPTSEPTGRPQDSDSGAVPAGPPSSGSASASSVAPGDTVTVQGTGFLPGERVVVQLRGGATSSRRRPPGPTGRSAPRSASPSAPSPGRRP